MKSEQGFRFKPRMLDLSFQVGSNYLLSKGKYQRYNGNELYLHMKQRIKNGFEGNQEAFTGRIG